MYIFLDCDGVINQLQPNFYIDEKCIKVIAKLVKKYNGRIVLISTWRLGFYHDYSKCTPQIKRLIQILQKNDIPGIYSRTLKGKNRTQEIDDFLASHEKDNYVILDDDITLFDNTKGLYKVNAKTGLAKNDLKQIERCIACI